PQARREAGSDDDTAPGARNDDDTAPQARSEAGSDDDTAPQARSDDGTATAAEEGAGAARAVGGANGSTAALELGQAWSAIVALVREGNALLGAVIEESVPLGVLDGELTVGFPGSSSFNKRKAESAANKEALGEAIARLTGQRLRLAFELCDDLEGAEADRPADAGGGDDLLRRIIAEFDAEELPAGSPSGGADTQEGA
ncbi:MAG: hypothetical protein ACYCX7_10310, partial [Solirubrobacteraceae bacterium]